MSYSLEDSLIQHHAKMVAVCELLSSSIEGLKTDETFLISPTAAHGVIGIFRETADELDRLTKVLPADVLNRECGGER